ncbi:MAG: hypothetical protein KBA26_02425 [Candidatus Delongbacteria bacterium]|nr:hypothetical protein [Candidatus Delongbacteria bacterium]
MKRKIITLIVAGGCLLLGLMLCSDYEDETYSISAKDQTACDQFSQGEIRDTASADTTAKLVVTDTLVAYALKAIDTTWSDSSVSTQAQQVMDSLESIHERIKPVSVGKGKKARLALSETPVYVTIPEDAEYSYVVLDAAGTSGKVVIYLDDYLELNLISASGQTMSRTADHLSLETYAYCRRIKTRTEIDAQSGKYLLQFTKTDKTLAAKFFLVIQN